MPYRAVLKLERRVSHDGMISVGGNAYSVPDTARRRVLDVHCLIDEVQIFEDGVLIARHTLLPGRGQSCIRPGTPQARCSGRGSSVDDSTVVVRGAGDMVARRSLEFYDALGRGHGSEGERVMTAHTLSAPSIARAHQDHAGRTAACRVRWRSLDVIVRQLERGENNRA